LGFEPPAFGDVTIDRYQTDDFTLFVDQPAG
jgi:hypothetical protein